MPHYQLLGLSRGECRVHVIRSAAQAMSIALTQCEQHVQSTVVDIRKAKIAIATYWLLDPRKRCDLYERIQLVHPIDREDAEVPVVSSRKLIDQMAPVRWRIAPSVSNDFSLEERRSIVRLVRQSNESILRGLSPLGWIRSRLGL